MSPNAKSEIMHKIFLARARQEKNGCIKCGRCITRSFYQKKNKQYVCSCLLNVSPMAGTPLHKTYIPLETWFNLIHDIIYSPEGIDCRHVREKYGLSHEASWNILYRIRDWINLAEEKERCQVLSRFIKVPDGLSIKYVLKYGNEIPINAIQKKMLATLPPLFAHIKNPKSIN